jgi:hypothetical protein
MPAKSGASPQNLEEAPEQTRNTMQRRAVLVLLSHMILKDARASSPTVAADLREFSARRDRREERCNSVLATKPEMPPPLVVYVSLSSSVSLLAPARSARTATLRLKRRLLDVLSG